MPVRIKGRGSRERQGLCHRSNKLQKERGRKGGLGRKNFSLWHSTEGVSPSPVGSSGMEIV